MVYVPRESSSTRDNFSFDISINFFHISEIQLNNPVIFAASRICTD